MAFIHYGKAFDLVMISAVMQALRGQGVGEPYRDVVEDIWKHGNDQTPHEKRENSS